MYCFVKPAVACLAVCGVSLSGRFTTQGESNQRLASTNSSESREETVCSLYEGWYIFSDILRNTGQFEARTIPDIPCAQDPARIQVRLSSFIRVGKVRTYVRFRSSDPFDEAKLPPPAGPWIELSPIRSTSPAEKTLRKDDLAIAKQRLKPTWASQRTYEAKVQLPEGPHAFEFLLVPESGNRWLPSKRHVIGWPVWIAS